MKKLNVHQLWLGFFVIWCILLTGLLDFWVESPGLKQWYKISTTLRERRQEIADVEARSSILHEVSRQLESNSIAQEREIRRVLGYLGDQEVVFEFTH